MSQRQATKEQQQIIEATEGNIRVRAVPGSGKTFALTKRIVYLILELEGSHCHARATDEAGERT